MSFGFKNPRGGKPTATSITRSQRSSCEVVIYRFDQSDITKMEQLNVSNDKSISGGGSRSTQGNLDEQQRLVIRNDVIRCNISKNKGSSSGTFSLTLKRGKRVINGIVQEEDIDYTRVIHPGDWIMIYMKKSGTVNINSTKDESGLKFLGVIENVRYIELDKPDKGSPRLEYIVTGRDFGKVFENDVYFNPIVNNQTIQSLLGVKFLTDGTSSVKGENRAITKGFTPDKVIKNLISFYLGGTVDSLNANNQTWYVPATLGNRFRPASKAKPKVSFVDILDTTRVGLQKYDRNGNFTSAEALPGAALIKSLPSSGSVWSIMEFMQNAAVNEMYTELVTQPNGDLKPSLILRQYPFSNYPENETNSFTLHKRSPANGGKGSAMQDQISSGQKTFFVDLPFKRINSSDIKEKNIGKSDHERVNHLMIVPKIDSKTYDLLYGTILNVPSIQRYGLRSIQTQTSYVLGQGEGIKNFLKRCLNLLADWFFASHQLFNGTVITEGSDEHVEIGTNLYIEDIKQLYHIEGYTHTYQVLKDRKITYDTEYRVSRGQVFDRSSRKANFIGPSEASNEPTTITTSVLEGTRNS